MNEKIMNDETTNSPQSDEMVKKTVKAIGWLLFILSIIEMLRNIIQVGIMSVFRTLCRI